MIDSYILPVYLHPSQLTLPLGLFLSYLPSNLTHHHLLPSFLPSCHPPKSFLWPQYCFEGLFYHLKFKVRIAVKPVLSGHLKEDKKWVFNTFKPSSKIFYCPYQGGNFFCGSFMFFSVLCLLCVCAHLFICALWSPAGKGLISWLSFVVSNCEFVTFSLVSWVWCGT